MLKSPLPIVNYISAKKRPTNENINQGAGLPEILTADALVSYSAICYKLSYWLSFSPLSSINIKFHVWGWQADFQNLATPHIIADWLYKIYLPPFLFLNT